MRLETLTLTQFRNIKQLTIEPSAGLNIILGENGAGKTSIVEAMYMLSGAKSFKKSKDSELVNFEVEKANISAQVSFEGYKNNICIDIEKKNGRTGFLDGQFVGRAFNLAGRCCAVVFSPDNLFIVKGGKENRRSFVDNALCNIYPAYINTLRSFNRLMQHKNAHLKQRGSSEVLDILDEQLAGVSEEIVKRRKGYIDGIQGIATIFYDGISTGKERLGIGYRPPAEQKEDFIQFFMRHRDTDLRYGHSNSGVHRDDIDITLNGLVAKTYASQGQQRSIVLSLKKAEAEYYFEVTGKRPILLFDDVLSELDEHRQGFLLKDALNCQTFFTACDERAFKNSDEMKFFRIENGGLKC